MKKSILLIFGMILLIVFLISGCSKNLESSITKEDITTGSLATTLYADLEVIDNKDIIVHKEYEYKQVKQGYTEQIETTCIVWDNSSKPGIKTGTKPCTKNVHKSKLVDGEIIRDKSWIEIKNVNGKNIIFNYSALHTACSYGGVEGLDKLITCASGVKKEYKGYSGVGSDGNGDVFLTYGETGYILAPTAEGLLIDVCHNVNSFKECIVSQRKFTTQNDVNIGKSKTKEGGLDNIKFKVI